MHNKTSFFISPSHASPWQRGNDMNIEKIIREFPYCHHQVAVKYLELKGLSSAQGYSLEDLRSAEVVSTWKWGNPGWPEYMKTIFIFKIEGKFFFHAQSGHPENASWSGGRRIVEFDHSRFQLGIPSKVMMGGQIATAFDVWLDIVELTLQDFE